MSTSQGHRFDVEDFLLIPNEETKRCYEALQYMRSHSHHFKCLWKRDEMSQPFLKKIIALIELHDSEYTDLSSLSCWFLSKLATIPAVIQISGLLSANTIRTLLHIGLTNNYYDCCFFVLNLLSAYDARFFAQVCDSGLENLKKFHGPIKITNYNEFLYFILRNLNLYTVDEEVNIGMVQNALNFLSIITQDVETDCRTFFFFSFLMPTVQVFFKNDRLRYSCAGSIASFLRAFTALRLDHGKKLLSYNLLPLLLENLESCTKNKLLPKVTNGIVSLHAVIPTGQYINQNQTKYSVGLERDSSLDSDPEDDGSNDHDTRPEIDSQAAAQILLLLTELCKEKSTKEKIFEDFPLQRLLDTVSLEDGAVLEAAVELFMTAYVPPRSPSTPATTAFLRQSLLRSVELIRTREGASILQGCRTIRRLNRSVNLLQTDLSDISSGGRQLILELFDEFQDSDYKNNNNDNSSGSSSNNNGSSQQQYCEILVLIIDALSALSGWKKVYWRSSKSLELRDIVNCLEDIRSSGQEDNDVSTVGSDGVFEIDDPDMETNFSMYTPKDVSFMNEERLSGAALETTKQQLLVYSHQYLDGILLRWSEMSYCEMLRCLVYISAITHCIGFEELESRINLNSLCSVLVDILLNNRYDVHDYVLMQERCLVVISDITLCQPHALPSKLEVCETVLKIISDWSNLENISLMLNSIAALVVLAYIDKSGPLGTLIIESVESLHHITRKLGGTLALSPLLFLCRELTSYISELDAEGLIVLVGWCVRGLRCEVGRTRLRACQIVADIGTIHPRLFFQMISRREIEEGLINALSESTEVNQAIEALKGLSVCMRNCNKRPMWTYDDWTLDWSVRRRLMWEPSMADLMSLTLDKFRGPHRSLVLAFCLDFTSAVLTSNLLEKDSELHKKLIENIVSQVPLALQAFMQGDRERSRVISNKENYTNHSNSKDDNSNSINHNGSSNNFMTSSNSVRISMKSRPSVTELDCIATELLAFHTLQLIQAFLCYDMNQCLQNIEFSQSDGASSSNTNQALCKSISKIMSKFPKNRAIQRFGMDILRIFTIKHIDLDNIGKECPSSLIGGLDSCPHDNDLLRAFCTIVEVLAKHCSDSAKNSLMINGIHKTVFGILHSCSRDIAPQALAIITNLSDHPDRVNALVQIGFVPIVFRVLDRHLDSNKVQVEGLRAILALSDSTEIKYGLFPEEDKHSLERVRNVLNMRVKDGSLGQDCDASDVSSLLKAVNKKFKRDFSSSGCVCLLS